MIIEKDILKNDLKYQNLIKKLILKYIDEISSNSITTFNSLAGEISYDYLKKVQTTMQFVEENINKLDFLSKKLELISSESDNETKDSFINIYNDYQKIISYNTLEIQKTLNSLLDYIRFDFSTPSTDYILKSDNKISLDSEKDFLNEPDTIVKPENEIIETFIEPKIEELNVSTDSITVHSNSSSESVIEDMVTISTPTVKPIDTNSESITKETDTTSKVATNIYEESNLKENVLLISHINNKVVLPYSLLDLKNIFESEKGKYNNLQEVVDKNYTIPMSYYKNASVSRFREAYSLVRTKSKGSIKEAFDLGLEVFFKYNLNPAIITACKNIDELDIYLACLEDNDVSDFHCFDIIYETLPLKNRK